MMITSDEPRRPAWPARFASAEPGATAGDQHSPGPADVPPGEPAPAGPVARRRVLHELLAVLRDQGLGDFRMHDASWLPFGTYWERVLTRCILSWSLSRYISNFACVSGLGVRAAGARTGVCGYPASSFCRGALTFPRVRDRGSVSGTGTRIAAVASRRHRGRHGGRCRRCCPAAAVHRGRGTRAARTRPARRLAGGAPDPCAR
jgi:hypothetical protein